MECVLENAAILLHDKRISCRARPSRLRDSGIAERRCSRISPCSRGGQVFAEELGKKLEHAQIGDLGQATRVVIDGENTTIIGGAGEKAQIAGRIEQIRVAIQKNHSFGDGRLSGFLRAVERLEREIEKTLSGTSAPDSRS